MPCSISVSLGLFLSAKEHESAIALPLLVDARLPVDCQQSAEVEVDGLDDVITVSQREGVSPTFFEWLKKAQGGGVGPVAITTWKHG